MNTPEIIAALDAEIARLQQARNLIAHFSTVEETARPANTRIAILTRKRSALSSEARQKIADAQRRRWTNQKSAKKAAAPRKQEREVLSFRKASAKTTKSTKAVQITRVPEKTRAGKRRRSPKKAAIGNSLSSRAEVIAVNKHDASVGG